MMRAAQCSGGDTSTNSSTPAKATQKSAVSKDPIFLADKSAGDLIRKRNGILAIGKPSSASEQWHGIH